MNNNKGTHMKRLLLAILATAGLCAAPHSGAQMSSEESATPASAALQHAESGVPIERLIATVAKKTGRRFVLDPRVRASVILVGQDPSELTYPQLLTVLAVYGYFAVDDDGYVRVQPDASIRVNAPLITSKDTRPSAQYVTQIIVVRNISAAQLVPILRPMVSQPGHLAATQTNSLIITDQFANVRRIESIVRTLDIPDNKPRDVASQKEPAQ
jgi:general secretion pathway protein D